MLVGRLGVSLECHCFVLLNQVFLTLGRVRVECCASKEGGAVISFGEVERTRAEKLYSSLTSIIVEPIVLEFYLYIRSAVRWRAAAADD